MIASIKKLKDFHSVQALDCKPAHILLMPSRDALFFTEILDAGCALFGINVLTQLAYCM